MTVLGRDDRGLLKDFEHFGNTPVHPVRILFFGVTQGVAIQDLAFFDLARHWPGDGNRQYNGVVQRGKR